MLTKALSRFALGKNITREEALVVIDLSPKFPPAFREVFGLKSSFHERSVIVHALVTMCVGIGQGISMLLARQ